jgi:hypothetical protein
VIKRSAAVCIRFPVNWWVLPAWRERRILQQRFGFLVVQGLPCWLKPLHLSLGDQSHRYRNHWCRCFTFSSSNLEISNQIPFDYIVCIYIYMNINVYLYIYIYIYH